MSQDELLRQAGDALGKDFTHLQTLRRHPTDTAELPSPDECAATIQAFRARGVKDSDLVNSFDFSSHPKAVKNALLPLSEVEAICAEYRQLYPRYKVAYDLRRAEDVLWRVRDGIVKPDESFVSTKMIEDYERYGDQAGCKAALATARTMDATMKVGKKNLTLDQYQTEVCDALPKHVPQWVATARAALRTRNEKAAAPFKAAGITGPKLDLLASYAGVYWRLPGGERTDDAKKLAAASVLFQWLEAADRADPRYVVHTIRRYQFRGNEIDKVSETQHRTLKNEDPGDVFR